MFNLKKWNILIYTIVGGIFIYFVWLLINDKTPAIYEPYSLEIKQEHIEKHDSLIKIGAFCKTFSEFRQGREGFHENQTEANQTCLSSFRRYSPHWIEVTRNPKITDNYPEEYIIDSVCSFMHSGINSISEETPGYSKTITEACYYQLALEVLDKTYCNRISDTLENETIRKMNCENDIDTRISQGKSFLKEYYIKQ